MVYSSHVYQQQIKTNVGYPSSSTVNRNSSIGGAPRGRSARFDQLLYPEVVIESAEFMSDQTVWYHPSMSTRS